MATTTRGGEEEEGYKGYRNHECDTDSKNAQQEQGRLECAATSFT